jgi:hypothetical protein
MTLRRPLLYPLVALALAACTELTPYTPIAPSTGDARVRAVHVAPTAPPVTIARAGATLASDVAFGAVVPATAYAATPAGQGELVISAGGNPVYRNNIPLARDSAYTIVALGNVGAGFLPGSARSFQPIVLRDTVARPATGAWLRLVHAADSVAVNTATPPAATSNVDVYVYLQGTPRPTAAPAAGTAIRVLNSTFRAVTAYVPLTNAGTYVVEVFVAGAAPATATPLVNTTVAVTNGLKATVIVRRPQVGASAAPLNAYGLVILPEA